MQNNELEEYCIAKQTELEINDNGELVGFKAYRKASDFKKCHKK